MSVSSSFFFLRNSVLFISRCTGFVLVFRRVWVYIHGLSCVDVIYRISLILSLYRVFLLSLFEVFSPLSGRVFLETFIVFLFVVFIVGLL